MRPSFRPPQAYGADALGRPVAGTPPGRRVGAQPVAEQQRVAPRRASRPRGRAGAPAGRVGRPWSRRATRRARRLGVVAVDAAGREARVGQRVPHRVGVGQRTPRRAAGRDVLGRQPGHRGRSRRARRRGPAPRPRPRPGRRAGRRRPPSPGPGRRAADAPARTVGRCRRFASNGTSRPSHSVVDRRVAGRARRAGVVQPDVGGGAAGVVVGLGGDPGPGVGLRHPALPHQPPHPLLGVRVHDDDQRERAAPSRPRRAAGRPAPPPRRRRGRDQLVGAPPHPRVHDRR